MRVPRTPKRPTMLRKLPESRFEAQAIAWKHDRRVF